MGAGADFCILCLAFRLFCLNEKANSNLLVNSYLVNSSTKKTFFFFYPHTLTNVAQKPCLSGFQW